MSDGGALPRPIPLNPIPQWTLGERLAKARRHAGYEQRAFAAVMGIGNASVARYERDHIAPKRAVLIAWANVTEVPLEWLEHGTRTEPEPPIAIVEPKRRSRPARDQGGRVSRCTAVPPGQGTDPDGGQVIRWPVAA